MDTLLGKAILLGYLIKSQRSWTGEEDNRIVRRELLCEVITTMKEIKIITELPGVSEERIKINPCGRQLEIIAENEKRKYYELINLPEQADTHKFKSTFLNGFLEVTLKKKSVNSRINRCEPMIY